MLLNVATADIPVVPPLTEPVWSPLDTPTLWPGSYNRWERANDVSDEGQVTIGTVKFTVIFVGGSDSFMRTIPLIMFSYTSTTSISSYSIYVN